MGSLARPTGDGGAQHHAQQSRRAPVEEGDRPFYGVSDVGPPSVFADCFMVIYRLIKVIKKYFLATWNQQKAVGGGDGGRFGGTMDLNVILTLIGLILAFIMALNIGGNDAANPTSPAVGAYVLSINKAIAVFAVFTVLGAALQGFMVMKTIGSGVVPSIDVAGAVAIVLGANIWVLIATLRGMAISTGHSIISAVVGYGVVRFSVSGLNLSVLGSILISWIASPLIALLAAALIYRVISVYAARCRNKQDKLEKFIRVALIVSLCFAAYSFGVNDVSHATGVYCKIIGEAGSLPDQSTMLILALYGAIGIVIGGATIGRRVIATLAYKVTRMDLMTALSASVANAITVYAFVTLPYLIWGYGLPISSSYASVGAIIGASFARSRESVNAGMSLTLVSYWVFTVPANIALTGVIYYLLTLLM